MNVHGSVRNEGQLKVTLNHTSDTDLAVKSGVVAEVVLRLRADFNVITLKLNASNVAEGAVTLGDAEAGALGIAFYAIELTSIGLLG
jgi:hypothetical protein